MTTIITRLYENDATAKRVAEELHSEGFPASLVDIIGKGANLHDTLAAARVPGDSAEAYADLVGKGNKLVVVRAPITPFGAALAAMRIMDSHPVVDSGLDNENVYIREEPRKSLSSSVMTDHPRFLTNTQGDQIPPRTTVSEALGFTARSTRTPGDVLVKGGGPMSSRFLPFPMLSSGQRKNSVISGGKTMIPFPTLSSEERGSSVRRGGGLPFSELFGLKVLSDRD